MSDFLTRLVERTQGAVKVAQPVIPPMFASVSNSLVDHSENLVQDSEPVNIPTRTIITPSSNDLIPATQSQSFQKRPGSGYRQIESDSSEQVESSIPQAINVRLSSDMKVPIDQPGNKQQKEIFSENNETSVKKVAPERDQNTKKVTGKPIDAGEEVSGRPVEAILPGQVGSLIPQAINASLSSDMKVPANLHKSKPQKEIFPDENEQSINKAVREYDQDIKKVIRKEFDSKLRDPPDRERNQDTDMKFNNLRNDEQNAFDRVVKIEHASILKERAEVEPGQNINLQADHSLNKKQEATKDQIYFNGTNGSRKIREPAEVKSAKASYLKQSSSGSIHFKEDPGMEPAPAESTIKVTIGRVEVRAIMPSLPASPRARSQSPILSLNDYLKQRNGGQR